MAVRTISAAGGNFNATATWDEGIVPVAGDAVVARGDGTSGQLTINVASGGIGLLSFIMTNYANTLTFNSTLTVSGTVTFVAGMTIAGTAGTLIINAASTFTSAGKTLTCGLTLNTGAVLYTLGDAWTVNGLVTIGSNTGSAYTVNGFSITCNGGLRYAGASSNQINGTTTITLAGTGKTWDAPTFGTGSFNLPITINCTSLILGTVALAGTITYVAGAITVAGSTLVLSGSDGVGGSTTVVDIGGVTWNNVSINPGGNAARIYTLNSDLNVGGDFTSNVATTTNQTINGTGNINLSGGLKLQQLTSGSLLGTANIFMLGTGTISSSQSTGRILNNLTINTSGTITFSGIVGYSNGTLTYTSGTVITTNSTLRLIAATTTLNTAGIIWHDFNITASLTLILNSFLTLDNTMSVGTLAASESVNFSGTSGFQVKNFLDQTLDTAARTHTFLSGVTYTITTQLRSTSTTSGIRANWRSSVSSSAAFVNFLGTDQQVQWVNATDIDSSGGNPIWDYTTGVVLTRTVNWNVLPSTPATVNEIALDLQTGNLRYVNGKVIVF